MLLRARPSGYPQKQLSGFQMSDLSPHAKLTVPLERQQNSRTDIRFNKSTASRPVPAGLWGVVPLALPLLRNLHTPALPQWNHQAKVCTQHSTQTVSVL